MKKPLTNRIETLIKSIHELREKCIPEYPLKLEYLTIFSKDNDDYENLQNELKQLGEEKEVNNGKKYNLSKHLDILGEDIGLIRVRKPDIHRSEIGCGDLAHDIDSYKSIRNMALEKGWDIILRKGYEMIELSSFDLSVYVYLVSDTE